MVKKLITINVKTKTADAAATKADLLAIGVFSDSKKHGSLCQVIDKKLSGAVTKLLKTGDFKAKVRTSVLIYSDGKVAAGRVLLVGLGEKSKLTADILRDAAAIAADKSVALKVQTMNLALHQDLPGKLESNIVGQVLAEGVYLGGYRYDEFISKSEDGRGNKLDAAIVEADASMTKAIAKGVSNGNIIGQAQAFTRTIANRPGNIITPQTLAQEAKKMAKATPGLSCTVFDDKQLKQKKAGGISAVGGGSVNKPRMIILKYKAKSANAKTVGLVGKAVTFDSGGISIKPSAGMDEMKFDKSGGIAVLGAMKAIAQLKPSVNVYGIIPAAENMPGGGSYRPGDIVTTMSGKTVEILNTDAEGRMILCDGIDYAVKQKCDTIIDIATLTGACVVALGKHMAGLMGSDDELIKDIKQASERCGEKVWHLPCTDEYLEEMKSKIADLKNAGTRWGGASTAAAFLGAFAGKTKWAHIDMAGVEIFAEGKKIGSGGSPGFGVRLLTTYVMNIAPGRNWQKK